MSSQAVKKCVELPTHNKNLEIFLYAIVPQSNPDRMGGLEKRIDGDFKM